MFIRFVCMVAVFALVMDSASGMVGTSTEELTRELRIRREKVMEYVGSQGMLILFSAEPRPYTGDVSYEFRQENNLYYLTGIDQQGVILVLMPGNIRYREILFISKRDPAQEIWTGRTLSLEEAQQISGLDNVWDVKEFQSFIDRVLYGLPYRVNRYRASREFKPFAEALSQGQAKLFLLLEDRPGLEGKLSKAFEFANRIRERFPGITILDISEQLTGLRWTKSAYELAQLQQAIDITAKAHRQAMATVAPGQYEYEVEATIEYVYKKNNAFDWGFPSIVGSGPNATTLHYEKNSRQMQDGELVLIDIGAEYRYYTADITRTIPVNGHFSEVQTDLYQIVLEAQQKAMAIARPGVTLADIHEQAVAVIKAGLHRLGLITDPDSRQYRMFFMHGTSHYLGMDVHDVGARNWPLKPGVVLTVEPGIYVREDVLAYLQPTPENQRLSTAIRPAVEKYKNMGVRIEDDIVVTQDGYRLLSKGVPRTIEEIEAFMQGQH